MYSGPQGAWTNSVKPFIPGDSAPASATILWTTAMGASITVTIASYAVIAEVYFPILPGAVTIQAGSPPLSPQPQGFPYITQPSGCESVPISPTQQTLTLTLAAAPSSPIYVFVRNWSSGGFRFGPVGNQVTAVGATAPITSSGGTTPTIGLTTPLAVAFGGTGTASPALVAGSGIVITGTPFNWTIAASSVGVVTSVGALAPLTSTGGTTPVIAITNPLPKANGGTGTATPGDVAGVGITITGSWPTATIANSGVLTVNTQPGAIVIKSTDTSVAVVTTPGSPTTVDLSVAAVGTTVVNNGNGGDPFIVLPGTAAAHYLLELKYGVNQTSNTNMTLTLTVTGGTVTNFATNAPGFTAFNAVAWILMYATWNAVGGQTITIHLATAGGSLAASPAQPWLITAYRTS